MLTIRMQRTGRKGLANYRIVVQDSRFSPTSGRVVSLLGHYNPHTKEVVLDKEKAKKYLDNGAQPTSRVVGLFKQEKVALPKWVDDVKRDHKKGIRKPEKLRKNQPAEEVVEEPAKEAPVEEAEQAPAEVEAKPEVTEEATPAEETASEAVEEKVPEA